MKFSIGIPAYNEAANIGSLLGALLEFGYGSHTLMSVVVYDDASSDTTAAIVDSFSQTDPRVILVRAAERGGSNAGWNYIFNSAESECIVKLDADIKLRPDAISQIVDAIEEGGDFAFGLCEPISRKNDVFLRAARFTVHAFARLQRTAIGAHFARGCLLAVRNRHVTNLHIPQTVINNDHYLAHTFERSGLRAVFVPRAVCYFAPAGTFSDYKKQSLRASVGEAQLESMGYKTPVGKRDIYAAVLRESVTDPVGALAWISLYVAARVWPTQKASSSKWAVAESTKAELPD